eukprot:TRINITY_DN3547_c0_g1_i2.p1 TRINITY_DN3547_c0_g1~~TRINITY_DN3547_c0_g1_i2.p1  ORF type:complete len:216 (-),score=47.52 TRINITY_DN3547_c0_g1_i2:113-709(-)
MCIRDSLKTKDLEEADKLINIGNAIVDHCSNEDVQSLEALCKANQDKLSLLRFYVEDGFATALNLKYPDVIEFFLKNGLSLQEDFEEAIITITKIAKYSLSDPPVDVLRILIKYGANVNQISSSKSFRTPLHYAAKSGNLVFVTELVESGAQIDPVDTKDKLPINYAEEKKGQPNYLAIFNYLRGKGSPLNWRETLKK